jgi:hypothetical protein
MIQSDAINLSLGQYGGQYLDNDTTTQAEGEIGAVLVTYDCTITFTSNKVPGPGGNWWLGAQNVVAELKAGTVVFGNFSMVSVTAGGPAGLGTCAIAYYARPH